MSDCYCLNLKKDDLMAIEQDSDKGTLVKINKKRHRSKTGITYQIIRYDKDVMALDEYKTIGLYRSVVCDLLRKKVVVFSPPKSISHFDFCKEVDFKDVKVEEYVEGTMINLFWEEPYDEDEGRWEIATRSTVEADNKFYKESDTFRDMFFEATTALNIDFNELPKKYCYSLILQHPKNRIVVPIKEFAIYLAEVYEIKEEDDDIHIVIRTDEFRESTLFSHPKVYTEFDSYDDYQSNYCSSNSSYDSVGIIFKKGYIRSKIRNPNYEEIRHLRGNDPKLQFIYLSLRKTGKLSMYLKLYNEHKKPFLKFREQMHRYTKQLHNNYLECFVFKKTSLKEMPVQFKHHLFLLHKRYLDHVGSKNKVKITFTEVKNYFNNLHPSQQMFVLNYNYRSLKKKVKSNDEPEEIN